MLGVNVNETAPVVVNTVQKPPSCIWGMFASSNEVRTILGIEVLVRGIIFFPSAQIIGAEKVVK